MGREICCIRGFVAQYKILYQERLKRDCQYCRKFVRRYGQTRSTGRAEATSIWQVSNTDERTDITRCGLFVRQHGDLILYSLRDAQPVGDVIGAAQMIEIERELLQASGEWLRYLETDLSQLAKNGETPRNRSLHVRPHHQVSVDEKSEVAYCRHRIN